MITSESGMTEVQFHVMYKWACKFWNVSLLVLTNKSVPGFKPFTMLRLLGQQSERLANNLYISLVSTVGWIVANHFGSTTAAKTTVLFWSNLNSPLNTQEAIQIVKSTCSRLIKAWINDCHRRLNYHHNTSYNILPNFKQLFQTISYVRFFHLSPLELLISI